MSQPFSLEIHHSQNVKLARLWLNLGLLALIFAGLFSILLVVSRTPFIQAHIPWVDFFHTALVVHVDMSVFIWFLAFAGVLWSLTSRPRMSLLNRTGWMLCMIGTIVIAILPFAGVGEPLMNNYIPVLQHRYFYLSLSLIGLGFSLLILHTLLNFVPVLPNNDGRSVINLGSLTAALAALATLLAFIWTLLAIADNLNAQGYFEYLFWGSGHVLQFTHTQLMLIGWLCLASASGVRLFVSPRLAWWLLLLGFLPVLITPYIYYTHGIESAGLRTAFTRLMQYGGGLAAIPVAILLLAGLVKASPIAAVQKPLRAALISSLLLFSTGGIIAMMIKGVNVIIPAHYHGSIVGVTLAFMGMSYYLLPKLGYMAPSGRLVHWQPYVYGGGQLMHILGLAWSGGYGVQRKTAGTAQGLDRLPEILGMGMMGLGGLIAIIGGLLFLVVMLRAMYRSTSATTG